MLTFRPRASSTAASEAADRPLPRDDTTPPVMNMYFVVNEITRLKLDWTRSNCALRTGD